MKNSTALFFVILLGVMLPKNIWAQWSTIPSADNDLNTLKSNPGTGFTSCTDGSGGAFYAFVKSAISDGNPDVFVNHIDKNGVVKWGAGINVNETSDQQYNPAICEDGHGGCYVAYENLFSVPGYPVFVQHFDSLGNKLWAGNGVRPLTIDNSLGQSEASLANNNGNGVFVTVQNTAFGGADGIHSQKLDLNGLLQWGIGGSRVKLPYYERNPETVADGSGGVMIIWFSAYALRAQHLNGAGVRQYDTANYFLNTNSISNGYKIIRDNDNRFIAVWPGDHADGTSMNIYAQKINIGGTKLWGAAEVIICDTTGTQSTPDVLSDNNGGAYFSWNDGRSANSSYYAQRVNSTGVRQWQTQGVEVYNLGTAYPQNYMVADINNGAKIFFSNTAGGYNIRMQSLNMDGSKNAPANGIQVTAYGTYLPSKDGIIPLANGEAIVFGEVYAGNYNQMYAKKVPQGCITAKPAITKITTACGPNSATLTWPGHLFSTYEVRYKISTAGSWTAIGNIGRVNTYTFSNLQANTAYKFQLRAICDLNNSSSPWANKNKTTQNCLMSAGSFAEAENISAEEENVSMKVYPNPANRNCIVNFNAAGSGQLKVFDLNSKIKYQTVIAAKQQQQVIDVSSFAAGIYICRFEMAGKTFTQKIVVIK
ncbi:MAG TPA: T9SS type A sorting domain-containing protein [Panacibacter sp.]|nr:T9SS type A sorting domain-containing protein [Panacibacter sp.]